MMDGVESLKEIVVSLDKVNSDLSSGEIRKLQMPHLSLLINMVAEIIEQLEEFNTTYPDSEIIMAACSKASNLQDSLYTEFDERVSNN